MIVVPILVSSMKVGSIRRLAATNQLSEITDPKLSIIHSVIESANSHAYKNIDITESDRTYHN